MSIGQRILTARMEAGLSQRQLAGGNITRNMLSTIEHDKAKPSLDTLLFLSEMLKKPVGYFLGEDIPAVVGYAELVSARAFFDAGSYRECLELLEEVPDGQVLEREVTLLKLLAAISLAEQALSDGREPYARELLEQAAKTMEVCAYATPELKRRLAILRAKAASHPGQLGIALAEISEDGVLILRSEEALEEKRYQDAQRYLNALDQRDARWNYLMGEALFGLKQYKKAVRCYHAAEAEMGKAVRRKLQLCYAELKDFEKAYRYATME